MACRVLTDEGLDRRHRRAIFDGHADDLALPTGRVPFKSGVHYPCGDGDCA